jgi:hypothetical protein
MVVFSRYRRYVPGSQNITYLSKSDLVLLVMKTLKNDKVKIKKLFR